MGSSLSDLEAEVSVVGADESARELREFGRRVDEAGNAQGSAARRSEEYDRNLTKVGRTALIAGGAVLAGLGFAVHAGMEFEQAMSGVAAVSDAGSEAQERLRVAAIKAGQATVFSATEAARAEAELAKAGLSVTDILSGGLTGALNLASAGQLELSDAAVVTAQALNVFRLDGSQASHVADVLAAGANKSAADVSDLGLALRQGALVAKQTGLSLEETVGALALFSDQALVGSDAGTSLKTMLQRLTPQSDEARTEMENLGIAAYDAQGGFVGLEEFAGSLQNALKDLTPEQRNAAMATIFGSDAVRAAGVLYDAGAKGVREYVRAVDDQGAAQRMAGIQMDNLAGDIEELSGSLETAFITGTQGATSGLRLMTQGATSAVNAFSNLPGPVQTGITVMTALTGATLLGVGAFGTIAPKWRETKAALEGLGAGGEFAAENLGKVARGAAALGVLFSVGPMLGQLTNDFTLAGAAAGALSGALVAGLPGAAIGAVLGGIAGELGLFGNEAAEARREVEELTAALGTLNQQKASKMFVDARIDIDALTKAVDTSATTFNQWAEGSVAAEQASDKQREAVKNLRSDFSMLAATSPADAEKVLAGLRRMQDEGGKPLLAPEVIAKLEADLDRGTQAYGKGAAKAEEARARNQELADAFAQAGGEAGDAASAVDLFTSAIDTLIGGHLASSEAQVRWLDSLASARAEMIASSGAMDINTEAGRKNRQALIGATNDAIRFAEASIEETNSIAGANMILGQHVESLAEAGRAANMSEAEIVSYVSELLGIPEAARTDIHTTADIQRWLVENLKTSLASLPPNTVAGVDADTAAAEAKLLRLKGILNGLSSGARVVVTAEAYGNYLGFGGVRAKGGPIEAGQMYKVGEEGEEWFVSDTSGYIYPHGTTPPALEPGAGVSPVMPAASGGTGTLVLAPTFEITPGGLAHPGEYQAAVWAAFDDYVRRNRPPNPWDN